MDRLDQEIINNIINTETMKNGSTNKPVYSGSSSSRGCSSPTLAAVLIILSILGWIYGIGSACVSSCNSKSDSSYSYTPRRSYSHSYSSRLYSSNNTYSSKSSSSYGSRSYGTYSQKSKSSSKTSDPYNAKDYYDAEDFYEDNYDDFWDYEEAEDYYNEHSDD